MLLYSTTSGEVFVGVKRYLYASSYSWIWRSTPRGEHIYAGVRQVLGARRRYERSCNSASTCPQASCFMSSHGMRVRTCWFAAEHRCFRCSPERLTQVADVQDLVGGFSRVMLEAAFQPLEGRLVIFVLYSTTV